MKLVSLFILLAPLVCDAAPSAAHTHNIDLSKEETSVEFLATVKPGSLHINGTGAKLNGTITIGEKTLDADIIAHLNELQTGISMRDRHMKEKFLEVEKYPDAELKIVDMPLSENPVKSAVNLKAVPFKGTLRLHGVDHPVTGTADVDSSGPAIVVEVKTSTSITAHKIEKPSYLGVRVEDDVEITAHMKLKK